MKVFYTHSNLESCYFVRCLHPLVANGWNGDRTSIRKTDLTPESKAKAAMESEVVVFHRPDDKRSLDIAKILKKQGKKIVFDNDDTYKDPKTMKLNEYMNEQRLKRGLKALSDIIDEFIELSDLVTCSTEFLKKEYDKLNKNVIVLPNCIDPFYFDEPLRNETNVVRIGVTGSIGVTADLDIAEPIIKHFENRKDVQIVLFSMPERHEDKKMRELYYNEYKFLDEAKNLEWHPFTSIDKYFDKLNELKLDIMIIPRADNYFNRCKSNLKFLEASMFEIPCIAQGFEDGLSPYEVNPKDAEHMIIVKDNSKWIEEVEKLIKDKQKRLDMGKKAHEYVLENYNIEDKAHLWQEAYETLYSNSTS